VPADRSSDKEPKEREADYLGGQRRHANQAHESQKRSDHGEREKEVSKLQHDGFHSLDAGQVAGESEVAQVT
jgi:hypothetical protein